MPSESDASRRVSQKCLVFSRNILPAQKDVVPPRDLEKYFTILEMSSLLVTQGNVILCLLRNVSVSPRDLVKCLKNALPPQKCLIPHGVALVSRID